LPLGNRQPGKGGLTLAYSQSAGYLLTGGGWILDRKHKLAAGHLLAVHFGPGGALAYGTPHPAQLHRQGQGVAGAHGTAEAEIVDAGEEGQLARVFGHRQDGHGPYLGQGFHDQDTRHDGIGGKMTGEEGLVGGDVLDAYGPPARLQLQDAVHQQKGMPVGNDLLNTFDVKAQEAFLPTSDSEILSARGGAGPVHEGSPQR